MSIYYIYFYLRSDFTPYYVGKGKKNRAFTTHKSQGIHLPKDKSKIILVEQDLTELQAFILERYYIRWFGRKDIGTGILRNKTDGGEGTAGFIHSEITKDILRKKSTGRILTEEQCLKISKAKEGHKHSNEAKEKMSESAKRTSEERSKMMSEKMTGRTPWNKGIKTGIEPWNKGLKTGVIPWNKGKKGLYKNTSTPERNENISKAKKGVPQKIVTCPECGKSGGISGMHQWHFDNCKMKKI